VRGSEEQHRVTIEILQGDVREVLATLPDDSFDCIVTSPPYWGQRDYGFPEQIGRERSASDHVSVIVAIFRDLRRILKPTGVCWLNYGDSWASRGWKAHSAKEGTPAGWDSERRGQDAINTVGEEIKERDLIGMSWTLALALRADGWWLRDCIVWHKPNPMPSSVANRTCPAHEYLFMLTKQGSGYFYDGLAIEEPVAPITIARLAQPTLNEQQGGEKQEIYARGETGQRSRSRKPADVLKSLAAGGKETRKRRSVWTVAVGDFSEAHFATFPADLIEPCIKAGCPAGGSVIDPFGGAGTTGLVADRLGRNATLIELNPDYAQLAHDRIWKDAGMFSDVRLAPAITSQVAAV
jgi:DNA modification methylase